MPTGYTAKVESGEITEFADFAIVCARAFGACIMMRDEPMDAPIPEKFDPSDYHQKAIAAATDRLEAFKAMNEADIAEACRLDNARALAEWEEREATRKVELGRYAAMREKVEAWTPPTPDHIGMKEFMLGQIAESTKYMSAWDTPPQPTPIVWFEQQTADCQRDIAYHTEEHAKEVERANGRTAWIKALRESLAVPA